MHRIDAAGATIDNHFTDGNPALAVPATIVDSAFLNDMQDEICSVIESRGIALVKGNVGQLLAAIKDLVAFGGNPLKFALANNQGVAADITGLLFDKTTIKGVQVDYEIYRQTDSGNVMQSGTLYVSYRTATGNWEISQKAAFDDDTGVTLSVTSSGQVQYISDNMAGTSYAGFIRLTAIRKFSV